MDKNIFNRPVFIYSVFAIVLATALAPVISFKYFPTVDGPAHLYNAKIIRELLWGDKALFSTFFKFNHEPVPNWTAHLFGVIAGVFFPAWMVEKLTVLLIVIGTLTGMQRLARAFGATVSWRIFLLLPFIYTITLYLGFFNFMFSIVLMLFVLSWMVKWTQHISYSYFVLLLFATTLLYFSHVLAFGIAIIFVGMLILWERLHDANALIFSRVNILKVCCFVPGLIFAFIFFSTRKVEGFRHKMERVPFDDLLKMVFDGSPLVGLNGAEEVPYTSIYMIGIAVLILLTIVVRSRNSIAFAKSDLLLVFAVFMFACYFLLPDGMAAGGFISVRLLLLALMFLVTWLLVFKMPVWISVLAGLLGVFVNFSTFGYRMKAASQLNDDAKNLVDLAAQINTGSIVLPLNYSTNWLHLNLSAYMGASADLVLLENYEADFDEFPLKWQNGFKPGPIVANYKNAPSPLDTIQKFEAATGIKVNYIARWLFDPNTTDSTKIATDKNLRSHFHYRKEVGLGDILFIEK